MRKRSTGVSPRRPSTTQRLKAQGFDLARFNRSTGHWHVQCSACAALVINNVATHETGCPNAHKGKSRGGGLTCPADQLACTRAPTFKQ